MSHSIDGVKGSYEINFIVGVATASEILSRGRSTKKVESRCARLSVDTSFPWFFYVGLDLE